VRFLEQNRARNCQIGCCNFSTNRAFVYAIEAARLLCSDFTAQPYAKKLLQTAIEDIDANGSCARLKGR
jgi:hypothetical protein